MPKVADYKKKIVSDIVNLVNQYPIIAAINMENLPAPQLQKMRAELRDKVVITMTKRRLIKIAFEEAKKTKNGIEQLSQYLVGMPALIFTKDSPFRLYKILQKSKSPAPAKPNQIAPRDIVIQAGPTPFAPGPIIGELAQIGVKAGVDSGKVAIKQDCVVVKEGNRISAKAAEILTRMGIEPVEVGIDLTAVYENGTIYAKDVLAVDEGEIVNKFKLASSGAFNIAMFISYPTQRTIKHLISKAANDAKALGISQNIIDGGIVEILIGRAEMSVLSLKNTANIEVPEKPKEEKKAEEMLVEPKKEAAKQKEKKEPEQLKQEKAVPPAENSETNKRVAEVVNRIKKQGNEPTSEQLVKEAEKNLKEVAEQVPTLDELAKRRKDKKEKDEVEVAQELLEKLKKKGTLRE